MTKINTTLQDVRFAEKDLNEFITENTIHFFRQNDSIDFAFKNVELSTFFQKDISFSKEWYEEKTNEHLKNIKLFAKLIEFRYELRRIISEKNNNSDIVDLMTMIKCKEKLIKFYQTIPAKSINHFEFVKKIDFMYNKDSEEMNLTLNAVDENISKQIKKEISSLKKEIRKLEKELVKLNTTTNVKFEILSTYEEALNHFNLDLF